MWTSAFNCRVHPIELVLISAGRYQPLAQPPKASERRGVHVSYWHGTGSWPAASNTTVTVPRHSTATHCYSCMPQNRTKETEPTSSRVSCRSPSLQRLGLSSNERAWSGCRFIEHTTNPTQQESRQPLGERASGLQSMSSQQGHIPSYSSDSLTTTQEQPVAQWTHCKTVRVAHTREAGQIGGVATLLPQRTRTSVTDLNKRCNSDLPITSQDHFAPVHQSGHREDTR